VARVGAAAEEARQQLDCRLGIEGAAAPTEQRRLFVQAGVGVEVEQLPLDVGDLLGARPVPTLVLDDAVVLVEVVQVVGGDDAEPADEIGGEPGGGGDRVGVVVHEPPQHVAAVHADADLPGQVVQADVVELDELRGDVEHTREVALEDHRGTAESDGLVPFVEERLRDDADGVREVDDPCAGRQGAHALGDVEHDGNRAERLREAAVAGRLLPEAAARDRNGLVHDPDRLAAHTQLDEHGVGALDRVLETSGRAHPGGVATTLEHAQRHPGQDREPLRVDVVQRQLVERQQVAHADQPVDELGRVRRASADHRQLHA
jgi:hypothetical protein